MWTMFFSSHHCFIILFQFVYIIFTLKVKKKTWKMDSAPKTPPPIVDLIHQNVFLFFTHAPSERSVGLQMASFSSSASSSSSSTPPTFCSYPAEKSSSFVPTWPKKAQVLFLPGRKKLKFCSYPAEKSSSFFSLRYRNAMKWGGMWVLRWVCNLVCF